MKTLEDLLEKVRELEPLIREHAAEAEASHRLPKVTVEAIRKAGLFRIWSRSRLGDGKSILSLPAGPSRRSPESIARQAGWSR